jgi:hypothetical protein
MGSNRRARRRRVTRECGGKYQTKEGEGKDDRDEGKRMVRMAGAESG